MQLPEYRDAMEHRWEGELKLSCCKIWMEGSWAAIYLGDGTTSSSECFQELSVFTECFGRAICQWWITSKVKYTLLCWRQVQLAWKAPAQIQTCQTSNTWSFFHGREQNSEQFEECWFSVFSLLAGHIHCVPFFHHNDHWGINPTTTHGKILNNPVSITSRVSTVVHLTHFSLPWWEGLIFWPCLVVKLWHRLLSENSILLLFCPLPLPGTSQCWINCACFKACN